MNLILSVTFSGKVLSSAMFSAQNVLCLDGGGFLFWVEIRIWWVLLGFYSIKPCGVIGVISVDPIKTGPIVRHEKDT